MIAAFEFATAQQIVFGTGRAQEIGKRAAQFGRRGLVVTGQRSDRVLHLLREWAAQGLVAAIYAADGEPTVAAVLEGVETARAAGCDWVIGIGGGSAVDMGKAIAALLTNPGEPLDYLEVVGKGQALTEPSAPMIAVPTTAGTGAEVTRNAVLAVPQQRVKVSLRSATMLPRLAVVDPELTYSMPPAVTASTGLDALTQCIEPFVSNQANPLTDAVAREGIPRAARSLRRAYGNGEDAEARQGMALASLFGGLALANAKLGAVHGFAGVLGGMFPIPHGIVCARLLPYVMAMNVAALQRRGDPAGQLARFDEVARLVTGESTARAADGVAWIQELAMDLQVAPLREFGLAAGDFAEVIAKSKVASSMKGNPLVLSDDELAEILAQAV
ncbi:MAG: iron-containing alcohol dehydrogenase [Caldilineaceae bacterium]|nr:iron-containing alcohol dehydrogenase [Caldilineaceae bacterium]